MANFTLQVNELVELSLDHNTPVSTLLRKALVVTQIIENKEFSKWVQFELNGYPDKNSLPKYRILYGEPMGHNQFRGWENIPIYNLDDDIIESITRMDFDWPISKIESDLKSKSDAFITMYDVKGEKILSRALHYRARPGVKFTRSQFDGMLEAIRNKILYWALAQQQALPADDKSAGQENKIVANQNGVTTVSADQLYEKAKDLYTKSSEINDQTAKLIIQLVDDAIAAFGNTNQEKKIELRHIKSEVEKLLPPATIEELRKRAEGVLLASYPESRKKKKILLWIVAAIVCLTMVATSWESVAPARFKPSSIVASVFQREESMPYLQVKIINRRQEQIILPAQAEFILFHQKDINSIKDVCNLLINETKNSDNFINIKAGEEKIVKCKFIHELKLLRAYEGTDWDFLFSIKLTDKDIIIAEDKFPFNKAALTNKHLPITIK